LEITGDIRIDRARIDLPKKEGPTLSNDVVVVGREQPPSRQSSLPFTPQVKVNIDFGDRFFLKGQGVDARLTGRIALNATETGLPVARGEVRVAEGSYAAYGQRLQIDKGVLTFNGPIDNPALDILALRKNQQVQAGVAITGTVLNPVVKLVSIPEVPDSDKLAWLVLGHGLDQAGGKDFDLLNAAASSILARGESVSLQSQIAGRAGLDEFRVSGQGQLEDTIVTLGKKLSSDVYVAYQRSVSGTTNVFTVKYKLSQRWSVQTQNSPTGTAADLLFTFAFD
jgi:translocation and assembly module TamB